MEDNFESKQPLGDVREGEVDPTEAVDKEPELTPTDAEANEPKAEIRAAAVPPQKRGSVWRDIFPLVIGEAIVSLLVIGVYLIVQACLPEQVIFSYKVITGAALGSLVIIVNYAALSILVGRVVNRVLDMRGSGEMTEEEAAEFANKNAMKIQNTVTKSYIIRTLSMVAALVAALFIPVFEVIATVVPLLMFKPILYATEFIRGKMRKTK